DHAEKLVRSGSTVKTAAADISINPDVLSKHLKLRGVKIPRFIMAGHNRITNLPEDTIINDYRSGVSRIELARRNGVVASVIHKVLERHGIRSRTQGEANSLRLKTAG